MGEETVLKGRDGTFYSLTEDGLVESVVSVGCGNFSRDRRSSKRRLIPSFSGLPLPGISDPVL